MRSRAAISTSNTPSSSRSVRSHRHRITLCRHQGDTLTNTHTHKHTNTQTHKHTTSLASSISDLTAAISTVSGGVLLVAGLLRLGFLVENLISHPTMMGFTQGAATLIILSQLKGLLNIPISPTAKTIIDYMCVMCCVEVSV